MAKLILCVFVVSLICATLAQDFEPPLLEDPKTTTLETPTITTEIPTGSTDAPSTEIPSSTKIPTTTKAATEPVTDSPFPTTQKPITTTVSTTKKKGKTTTTSLKPGIWYPNIPNLNKGFCYYKSVEGFPQLRWQCGQFRYVTLIECFQCCLFTSSYLAGCYKVNSQYCKTNNISFFSCFK